MSQHPAPWTCSACSATEGFCFTLDRILHVTRGHVGRVVDSTGFAIQWTGNKDD